jgi:hypothetical protein
MEVAGLIVYFFALAMVFTIVAILMLFGSGMVADAQASMNPNPWLKSKPSLFVQPAQNVQHLTNPQTAT